MNQKLEKYIMKLNTEPSREFSVQLDLPLRHYTSLAAFQNIVQEDKLIFWATDIHYLNDKNEWEHAQNIYKVVCENLLKNGKIDQNIYKSIVNIKPDMETTFVTCSYDEQKNMDIISGTSKISAKFVICFSTENDSLPMWNYYSNGTSYCGCNLGTISNLLFDDDAVCSPRLINSRLYKVIYRFDDKEKIIEEIILGLIEKVDSLDDLIEVQKQLAYRLSEWCFCFKDSCFEYEREVRLCVDLPREDYASTVKYRVNHGMLIPYIELELKKDILLSVMIGPLTCEESEKELQKNAMHNMLAERGYSCDYISFSHCPIRF